ncbi:MAG TPA: ABC transporter ATP-binding protein, partial [Pedococcus sp.]|nr:ABC transporter ATP-binding protein [Pedococcus sp.]
ARTIRGILEDFAGSGGTVVLSSHVMELVERICTDVAILAGGVVRAAGPLDDVRGGMSLEDRFLDLVGGAADVEGLAWLRTSSD